MAATITQTSSLRSTGDRRTTVLSIQGDASYPTGGYPVSLQKDFQLGVLDWTEESIKVPVAAVQYAVYNKTTNKLQLFVTAGTEVANATNVAALVVQCTGYGTC